MAEAEAQEGTNPFERIYQDTLNTPAAEPAAPAPDENPFAAMGPSVGKPSATGAFVRGAERSAIPAVGTLAGAGAGVEVGAAVGILGGPLGAALGGLAGGIGGGMLGGAAVDRAQSWILSKLPDSWREAIGQSDRQQQLDRAAQPTASFMGGLVPYAFTMRPGALTAAPVREGASALERVLANPVTARVFGGGIMGGMEVGSELNDGEPLDWRNIAISTGFGVIFNKPTKLGERITGMGERPVQWALHGAPEEARAPAPDLTVAQANDAKVIGAGVTESVFQGSEEPSRDTAQAAQQAARTEDELVRNEPPAAPDIHTLARQIDPDTFAAYDEASRQRDTFREWLGSAGEAREADPRALEIQSRIDGILDKVGGVEEKLTKGASGRLADAREQLDAFLGAHLSVDTPEMTMLRARLVQADEKMRDLAPSVSAAYRRAEEMGGPIAEETMGNAQVKDAAANENNVPAEAPQAVEQAKTLLGKEHPIGSGEPPKRGLVVAGVDNAGRIHYGKPGDVHGAIAHLIEVGPDDTGDMGFAGPDGKFLTREEALSTLPADDKVREGARAKEGWLEGSAYNKEHPPQGSVGADLGDKLITAGRPEVEARASAAVVHAYYDTRAARFEGKRGTGWDMYQADGPEIVANRIIARKRELELAQQKTGERKRVMQGKIDFMNGRRIITLFKDADASTFMHEIGHHFLDDLVADAEHPLAPDQLKADAAKVREWLKLEPGAEIPNSGQEKWARGFERYLMEGTAPSRALSRVFAQFKNMLTSIYQSVRNIKYQKGKFAINEDIRQVFDRMLAKEPERIVVAPEPERAPGLAEIHEADAAHTEPHEADGAADRIAAEAGSRVETLKPEVRDEVAAAIAKSEPGPEAAEPRGEAQPRASEGEDAHGGGARPGAEPGGGNGDQATREIGQGGSEAPRKGALVGRGAEGAGAGQSPGPSTGPNAPFGAGDTRLVDKAGNIRRSNINAPDDVWAAIKQSADQNEDFIGDRRGRVTDGQTLDLADALGMDAEKLNKRKIGDAFNAHQIVAAIKLLIESATDVRDAMKRAAESNDMATLVAYATAKDRHAMIQGQVSGIVSEAGRALRIIGQMKNMVGGAEAQQMGEFLKGATGKTLYQLRMEAKMGAKLETPQQVSKFVQDAQKHGFGRMILEYWVNGLISGPATHTTYMVGNTILAIDKAGPETAAAALIGAARQAMGRKGEVVRIGEVGAQFKGAIRSIPHAISAAGKALETGVTTLLPGEEGRKVLPFQPGTEIAVPGRMADTVTMHEAMADAFGAVRGLRDGFRALGTLLEGGVEGSPLIGAQFTSLGSIPDIAVRGVNVLPLGTAARLPSRAIAAIHSFFRAVNYSMEKSALAYRGAMHESDVRENLGRPRMTGEEFDQHVANGWTNPTPDAMEQSVGMATNLTLMGQGSKFVQALSKLTNTEIMGFPLLKFVDPFVHIAGNIIDQSIIQRTPLGILAPEVRADLMGKNGTIAQDTAMARMLVGTGLAITFGGLAAQGLVSGSGPSDPRQAAMWRLAGNQAHSVRIGDVWYDVHRLGPMGMLLGIAADMYDIAHVANTEDMSKAGAMLVHAITQNILDESFMRGPSELIRALEDGDRYGDQYVRNFLSSFVPYSVGMAQMARAADPWTRQTRSTLDAIKAKIPGLSQELLPRRDIWGEPIPNREALAGAGVTAIYETKMSTDPVNQAMLRLSEAPGAPERKIRNVELSDHEYDDFSRISGRMTKMRLDAIVRSPDFQTWPQHVQRDVIEQTIRECRETARGVILAKYPHIIRDATAAKLSKLKG